MDNLELIKRYIYAVVKQLPSKIREDVSKELQTLIDDMLEARCGLVIPSEKDVKVVLTELGTPAELAKSYNPDKDRYLIGPRYFAAYKMLLTLAILAVAFGILISSIVTVISSGTSLSFIGFGKWIASTIMGLVYAFAFVTIFFAFFEKKGISVDLSDNNLDTLPPVPQKQESIKKSESIISIIVSIIFAVCFILAPEVLFFYTKESGIIPIFDPVVIRSIWYLIIILSTLDIFREAAKLHEGRYTKKLAAIIFIVDIFICMSAYFLPTQSA